MSTSDSIKSLEALHPAHPHYDHSRPHVVIIGGGFAGLEFAKGLMHEKVDVTMVDKHNYHTFQPLLYQVATGGLEPDSIAYPLRKVFRKAKNVYVRWANVKHIDIETQTLSTSLCEIHYDYLVIATGSTSRFFNFENIQDKMLTLKSVPDALNLRSYILQNFEKATAEQNPEYFQELINIAVVGGGPTGLELAGALGEMKQQILPLDYPEVDLTKMRIVLFQAGNDLLAGMSDLASEKSLKYIKELGVEVRLNDRVSEYDGDVLKTEGGFQMRTDTLIWTAGVKATFPDGLPEASINKGRISVDRFNKVVGVDNVYAIGDVAEMATEDTPHGHPMVAPVAQQQGKHLAKNLVNIMAGKETKPFTYNDKGSMATIGRNRAVVDLPNYSFSGFFAWLTWMFVHVALLAGFRNKIAALFDWIVNYFTFDSPMRLIIRPFREEGVGTDTSLKETLKR